MKYFLTIMILAVALQSIAALCPETDGIGVYHARSFLEYQGDFTYDDVNCAAGQRSEPSAQDETTQNMRISPNPSTGIIRVRFTAADKSAKTIFVTDLNGKELLRKKVSPSARSTNLDLSDFSAGIYFVQCIGNNARTEVQKIIISH